jgi:hypothetical protein
VFSFLNAHDDDDGDELEASRLTTDIRSIDTEYAPFGILSAKENCSCEVFVLEQSCSSTKAPSASALSMVI